MRRFLRFCVSPGMPLAALALHFVICLCFLRRWDKVAAVTIFPFWAWGLLGLLLAGAGWIVSRSRFSLAMMAIWLVSIVVGADETKPLLRVGAEKPQPGAPAPWKGQPVLRAITLNCKSWQHERWGDEAARETIAWQPDVLMLQESPPPHMLSRLASDLFGKQAAQNFSGGYDCAVVSRWPIVRSFSTGAPRHRECSVLLPDGRPLELVCLHLQGAVTDLRLYSLDCWRLHKNNRLSRRAELQAIRIYYRALSPARPALLGGDFNAPADDAVFRLLEGEFADSFEVAGSGWGNTFPNASPLVRIDHLYSNRFLSPVRSCTVRTQHSDHRMVVTDFVWQK